MVKMKNRSFLIAEPNQMKMDISNYQIIVKLESLKK
jgi:hypothetical protein